MPDPRMFIKKYVILRKSGSREKNGIFMFKFIWNDPLNLETN